MHRVWFGSIGFPCWSLFFGMLGCKFAAHPSIDRPLYKVNSQALFSFESAKRMLFALFGGVSKSLTTFVEKTRGLSPRFAQIGQSISVPNSPQRRKVRQVQEPGKKLLVRSSLLRIEKTRGLPPSFAQIGLSISVPNSPQRRKVRQVQEPGKKLLVPDPPIANRKNAGTVPEFCDKDHPTWPSRAPDPGGIEAISRW